MLEAVTKDLVFTISLKRSTQNLQLSTSWAGRLHHLSGSTEPRPLSLMRQRPECDGTILARASESERGEMLNCPGFDAN